MIPKELTKEEVRKLDLQLQQVYGLNKLKEILEPFLKTAKGIPDNWPAVCSLFYEIGLGKDGEEYAYINYHSYKHDAGPKIGDYRKLEEWCKKYFE